MFKIFAFIPKLLKNGRFILLCIDTVQYFYSQAIIRGLHSDSSESKIVNLKKDEINE